MNILHLRNNKEYVMASYLLGRSTVDLSEEFGVNAGQVSKFLRDECEVKMRGKSKIVPFIFHILDLYKKGHSKYKIARELGISERSISKVI